MKDLSAFPKIWNLGNNTIRDLFNEEVEITEKVDGSQFGFGITKDNRIVMRSKGVQLYNKDQNSMFNTAIEQVERIAPLLEEWNSSEPKNQGLFFYGEYLNKPKHNVLNYERIPKNNIILFGCKIGENIINDYEIIKGFADDMDFEVVPLIFNGKWEQGDEGLEKLREVIHKTPSVLGKQVIEGVVIKNYKRLTQFEPMGPCFGKYVRESFKEKHSKDWKNISGKNKIQEFVESYRSEARWLKAVQHLKERGELENSPRDIGKIFKEIAKDIEDEETETIQKFTGHYYMREIKRKACAGAAEWYKDYLMQKQFDKEEK